jgi:hypothetical protein
MTPTKQAVRKYLAEGWQVLPIPRGEKGPRVPNWQTTTFDETAFSGNENVGIRLGEPSQGLTDIDLDSPEAIAAAPLLLLNTGRIHGRAGKTNSHYWYISPGSKSEAFKDVNGSVLVEIRSTGGQTVVPPSLHPSGESLEWAVDREANTVDPSGLRHAARSVAIAALLARHWPAQGARHEVAGLAAGMLATLKVPAIEIELVIGTAAQIAGDDGVDDRTRFARDTAKRFEAGQPTSGGPKLSDLINPEVVKRIRQWFGGHNDNAVEELNEKHAVIFQQSGDLVIITEDRDCDGRPFLRFSAPETIRQLYPQPVVVGTSARNTPIIKPLGQVWLTSSKRRFYNGIELAPNGRATPGYYNMWRGFSVEPKPGDWSLFQRHIREVICSDDLEIFKYVISWMANAVQKPGYQANTAIALRGGQGTGKGAFVRGFGALFGVHFIHLDSTRHLTGNFNAHLHNAILVFADEAAWPGDKAGLGALKRLITEPTLSIERKGMDIFTVPNVIHLILASNEDWAVPAAIDERRFVVLDVDRSRQNDTPYFDALENELFVTGGLSAMLYDLLQFKIEVNLRIIPKTEALFQQKQITNNTQRRWWYQVVHDGDLWTNEVPGRPGVFRIDREALYNNYVQTLDKAGQRTKSIQTELGTFLKKALPEPFPETYRFRDASGNWAPREWLFPALAVCREHYDREYGAIGLKHWPDEDLDAPLKERAQQLEM